MEDKNKKQLKGDPLVDIKYVAWKLSISVSTVRNYINNKDWDNIPKPIRKIGRSHRWIKGGVDAFANGYNINYKTLDKNKAPKEWAEFLDKSMFA